jgi:hypothetical protein
MIIAVYDHEHYAHMLTIEFIVSDIKELFATKYGRTPLVGLPDQRITCCTGESSENSLLIRNYTAAAPSPELLHEPSLDQPLAHKDRTASPTVPSEQVARESIGFDLTRNTNLKKKSANSEHGDSFDPPSAHQSSAKPNKINGFRLVLKMAALCLATFIVGMVGDVCRTSMICLIRVRIRLLSLQPYQ